MKYNATILAEKYGVVYVAANYRVDSLGWLALQELEDGAAVSLTFRRFSPSFTHRFLLCVALPV
jgi:carboxylesterase type B